MSDLHSLLKRQLRRFAGETGQFREEEQTDLLRAINEAYWQFDSDRLMLEHSLELTSQELLERNAELSRINTELELRVAARTEELQQSETLFRALFDLSPDAVVVIDPHASWPIIDCNVAACVMNGYKRDELIGQSIDILNSTAGAQDERTAYMEQLQLAGNLKLEVQHRRKDGSVFPVEVSTTLITVGERELVISIDRDITRRTQAETALREAETKYRTLVESMPAIVYVDLADESRKTIYINSQVQKMLGYSPEDWITKPDLCVDIVHPEDSARMWQELDESEARGRFACDYRYIAKDGHTVWVRDEAVLIESGGAGPSVWQGVMLDITAQKTAEEALRQSEERFRLMSWATKDAVWDWDLTTNQIWWGEGLQKILHYSPETVQSSAEWRLDHIHPEDQAKVDHAVHQALEGGMEFWSKEYRFRRNDGTYADIMDRGYILRDDSGKQYRMIGAMMDITERKQNEETIRQQNNMLSSLHQVTLDLLRYHELDPLLDRLVELSAEFMDASYVEIMLLEGETLVVKAATQNQDQLIGRRLGRHDAVLSWQAFDTREPAVLSNYANWPQREAVYDGFLLQAVSDFPILNDDRCLGVLALGRDKPDYEFTFDQIQSGGLLASLTALVLNNVQLREALREQSIRDPLTGLFNRRYMEEALKQHLSRVTRHLHPLAVIMLDIDHFKQINDAYGHGAGDAFLRELGQLLRTHVRAEDIACRYGGEEFVLIMPDASLEAAQQRAEYLRRAVQRLQVQHDGQSLEPITLSLGVAAFPEHGRTPAAVLSAADTALYRAKQAGRDRVLVA